MGGCYTDCWSCLSASPGDVVVARHQSEWRRSRRSQEIVDSHHIVQRQGKLEHPSNTLSSTMTSLLHQTDGLHPSEDLLDKLPLPLTCLVPGMSNCTTIDSTGTVRGILCHMRCDLQPTYDSNKVSCVVMLVRSDRDAMVPPVRDTLHEHFACIALGSSCSKSQTTIVR